MRRATGTTIRSAGLCVATLLILASVAPALAQRLTVPAAPAEVVGALFVVSAAPDETLVDIAVQHKVGQDELVFANPSVDRWLVDDGARITLPTAYILPRSERRGLVLNVPEMRLYYYPPPVPGLPNIVHTYAVSIGRMDWATPLGETAVVRKTEDPSWRPPESIIEEHANDGDELPQVVPPGPDNPLGKFAIRLGLPGYLIHGTNRPSGIGMSVTHGCVRMYPDDIEQLYGLVSVGTRVAIVDQPIKIGWLNDLLYIEVHAVAGQTESLAALQERARLVIEAESRRRPFELNANALKRAVERRTGIPTPIAQATAVKAVAAP